MDIFTIFTVCLLLIKITHLNLSPCSEQKLDAATWENIDIIKYILKNEARLTLIRKLLHAKVSVIFVN